MSTQDEIEILKDCIRRVDRMIEIVRQLIAEVPANQAIGLREETNLQRKQLNLEPLT